MELPAIFTPIPQNVKAFIQAQNAINEARMKRDLERHGPLTFGPGFTPFSVKYCITRDPMVFVKKEPIAFDEDF